MKTKASQKKIRKIGRIIAALVVLFIIISFAGFYMSSVAEIEALYIDLIKFMLILDMLLIFICNGMLRGEKSKFRYSREYTLTVSRK